MSSSRCLSFFAISFFLLPLGPLEAKGRVLVKLNSATNSASSLSLPAGHPGWKYLRGVDLYIVGEEGRQDLEKLQKEGAVDRAEGDAEIKLERLPDDPLAEHQDWITGEKGMDIGIQDAWEIVTGNPRVTVALIDTGLDIDHEDLKDNLWVNEGEIPDNRIDDDGNGFVDDYYGYNFWGHDSDIRDENNHGTHLAGIIGALGDNGVGIAGINWNIQLMPLKFTDAKGAGSSTGAVEAIDYAIRSGADVINASWTLKLEGDLPEGDNLLEIAIKKAGEAGILFVTASGNQFASGVGLNIDDSPVYPARFALDNLITVAALDEEGGPAPYSNYGPHSVDLAAPGSGILSAFSKGKYGVMSGTSVATAFVSGSAALLLSLEPDLKPLQLKSILLSSVTEQSSLKNFVSSGGRLHLGNSVDAVNGGLIPSVSETEPATAPPVMIFPAGGCSLVP